MNLESTPGTAAGPGPALSDAGPSPRLVHLANGLQVVLVDSLGWRGSSSAPTGPGSQAPLVTSALVYRAGTRDEPAGHGGVAHFLEHMMFKGSGGYEAGEIDRRTQALGGANNAFTSHDATAYFFSFAADRWHEALAIESDRMAGLTLDPDEVDSERRVVIEEIAMYEDDPWDALQQQVQRARFGDHPYGQPVLGTADELSQTGPETLRAFHRDAYRPNNAILAVVGAIGDPEQALEVIERSFGSHAPGDWRRPALPQDVGRQGLQRVVRRKGEMARLLLALPLPSAESRQMPAIRLLATVLGGSRSSRLHRRLVDENELAVFAVCETSDFAGPGQLSIAAEALPGAEPQRIEAEVIETLDDLASGRRPITQSELDRARRLTLSDWAFGHERVEQQAITLGLETALFEPGWNQSQLDAMTRLTTDEVASVAAQMLDLDAGAVVGWSLPKSA